MILKYFFAWFGMMILAVINGGFRDFAYKSHVGDSAASAKRISNGSQQQ
jgi:hypothetical protein